MTIGIHASAAFRNAPTGVEYYTRQLLGQFQKHPDADAHRFLLYTNDASDAGQDVTDDVRVLRWPFLWTQMRLSWEILRRAPDVLFVPAQALPRVVPRRTVAVIHGVEFKRVPSMYPRWQRAYLDWITSDALRRATRIIAVSHATKQDLLTWYHANPAQITVIHHGVPEVPTAEIRSPECGIQKPYFLFIGRLELKKNVDGIVRAFTLFKEKNPAASHQLVLAGSPGFGFSAIEGLVNSVSCREAIHRLGYVSQLRKWALLQSADAFVFPSHAEGFGFPIVEAQSAGTPVITGNTTAMPEVAGERGALFVEPSDTEGIAEAMHQIVEDTNIRNELVEEGKKNVERFSWERTARETLRVLTSR